jgi:hypothetical protein
MVADHDELDPFLASIARELKRPVHLDARFDERVMSALEPGIIPMPGVRRTPQPWYRRPFSVTVTPIRMMAAAAALVGVASVSLLRSGASTALQVADNRVPDSVVLQPVANVTPAPADRAVAEQFIIVAPGATSVSLVGEFNDWDATRTPMQRVSDDGTWLVTVPLMPGRYEFQYEIDGVRRTDPSRPQTSSDFGSPNSVVSVQGRE